MRYLQRFAAPVIVLIFCIFAIFPLLNSYFYPMHDDEQIARLYDLDQALMSGNIPPRVAPNLGFGYGYPFFNFYPPFAYYTGEFFHLLGFGYIASTKLMLVAGFVFSAFFMYIFSKEFLGKLGGVIAAVSYTYISYKAVDVYVRGAYAEFFAFVFIPLIFWAVYKLAKTNNLKYVVLGSLGTAGLILSHNLVAFMSSLFVGIWILYLFYISKNKSKLLLYLITLFLLGFGLSAYFFLPSYFEKGYTLVNILTSELADYKLHFVCSYQLWDSMWGYGGSILGCHDGISFEIGKIQLVISAMVFLFSIRFLVSRKNKEEISVLIFFFIMLGISMFMMVKYSRSIWDAVSPLWYIQFPWRFLIFSGFAASFLTGSIALFIKGKTARYILGVAVIILIIAAGNQRFTPQRFVNVRDKDYTNSEKLRWETSSLAYEYVPLGIATKKSPLGTTQVDISKNEIASSSSKVISGIMRVSNVTDLPQYKKFELLVFESGVFQINTYSFPGWTVTVDGEKKEFTDDNKFKLLRLNVFEGKHVVEARFLDTPVRAVGNITSIVSIIILVVILIRMKSKHAKT